MTPLQVARWLVHERGCSVLPLDHPAATRWPHDPAKCGKRPVIPWKWFQTARPSDDNLALWFGGRPRNIGIITGQVSHVVVIDGDSPAALAWMRAHLPPTEMRTATAKGEHWYYRHPGVPVRNKARLRIEERPLAIDIRADGGFCVAPSSQHASGHRYARLGSWPPVSALPVFQPAWLPAPVPPPPAVVVPLTTDRNFLIARAQTYLAKVPGAISGQGGGAWTFFVACRLVRRFGLSDDDAMTLLREWNATCVPPWSERELAEKIRGAHVYGHDPIGDFAAARP